MIKISLIAILTLSILTNTSNANIENSIEQNINPEIKDIQNSKLSKETKELLGKIYSRKLQDNKARKKQKITMFFLRFLVKKQKKHKIARFSIDLQRFF